MVSFIIPLSFYFVASVSCLPFFSTYKSLFIGECANSFQQDLDISQGLKPDTNNNANFGK